MAPPDPNRVIPLGRVVDAWGVRGWVKVDPYAGASDTTLTHAAKWHMARAGSPAHAPIDAWLQIERARRHSAGVVAKPVGCEDRAAAEALKGTEVGVRRCDFPPPRAGEVYWVDLLGCVVVNTEGVDLGAVTGIDDHGAHPILHTDAGMLIPYVDAYVVDALPEEGRIVVDWQADWSS